jgi:hypothetical protein
MKYGDKVLVEGSVVHMDRGRVLVAFPGAKLMEVDVSESLVRPLKEPPRTRKPISVTSCGEEEVIVLLDDGSMRIWTPDEGWNYFPPVPGTPAEAEDP